MSGGRLVFLLGAAAAAWCLCCLAVGGAEARSIASESDSSSSSSSLVRVRRAVHPLSLRANSYFRPPATQQVSNPRPARSFHKLMSRRTLPFQLAGESPMAYSTRTRNFVDEGGHRVLPVQNLPPAPYVASASTAAAGNDDDNNEEELSPDELLSMLNKMAGNLENRHRVRFGFF